MSYNSLTTQTRDPFLQDRIIAAAVQEAFENASVSGTDYAVLVRANPSEGVRMVWPVALATEAEYASALAANIPDPGKDESVITDGMILSATQTNWPADTP